MDDVLKIERANSVVKLTLHRPERRNALDAALVEALLDALKKLRVDLEARVVVLSGAGDTFCAGADLEWMLAMAKADAPTNLAAARMISDVMRELTDLPQVTVARVNGPVFGGGLGLVAACDIAIAVPEAEMAFSEVRLGLAPAVIAPAVIGAIGARAAKRLFLTAERFAALEAMRLGLVHEVVTVEDLDNAVDRSVQLLLAAGPKALRACKRVVHEVQAGTNPETLAATLADLRASDEGREGLVAFFAKRLPRWRQS
jgi:methylglutaconyl-CoA hydratase